MDRTKLNHVEDINPINDLKTWSEIFLYLGAVGKNLKIS